MSQNVIVVRNSQHVIEDEGTAAVATIRPGHLLDYDANGDLIPHGEAAAENVIPLVADLPFDPAYEKADTYPVDNRVRTAFGRAGVEFDMLLAAGESVDPTTTLVSAGDGTLRAIDTAGGDGAAAGAFRPTETVDNGGGAEAVRVTVTPI